MKNLAVAMACFVVLAASATVRADGFKAQLSGYQEVPPISTPASGAFKAKYDKTSQVLSYELSYNNLQGTIRQAHIHFAQPGVNGSITVWLCQTATNPAPVEVASVTPVCPSTGTVSGTILDQNVLAISAQGIQAEDLNAVLAAMNAGTAYVNVHTTPYPAGEIRGQIGNW